MPRSPSGGLPEGSGALILQYFDTPGVGLEFRLDCPPGQRRLVFAINFTLTTSATVANRRPIITRSMGDEYIQASAAQHFTPASSGYKYTFQLLSWATTQTLFPPGFTNSSNNELPPNYWWWSGLPICIRCYLLQADDQIGAVWVFYQRWLAN